MIFITVLVVHQKVLLLLLHLSCYGGQIQGRLVLDEEEKVRAKKLGITDFKRKYNIDDMVKGDVIFALQE